MRVERKWLSTCVAILVSAAALLAQDGQRQAAFPGAEGFGALARGGRGGDVYIVENLADAGPGSVRFGVQSATGPRTIVFAVSGTIELNSDLLLNRDRLTLAGQTAPGDGITFKNRTVAVIDARDVIVRYLRFRPGDEHGASGFAGDALAVYRSQDVILDHVSASWGIDEVLSVTQSDRVTVQWSFITESLHDSFHPKGPHGMGSLISLLDDGGISFHHNLYAHHNNRSPRAGSHLHQLGLRLDFVNNVIYDWGARAGYSGGSGERVRMNYEGNFLIAGPSTAPAHVAIAFVGGSSDTVIHQADNRIDSVRDGALKGLDYGWGLFAGSYSMQAQRFAFAALEVEAPDRALKRIDLDGGAALARDAIDRRILQQVRGLQGGVIDSQSQVGGWPSLQSLPAPLDSDRDGMPDAWELQKGLDPQNPLDRNLDTDQDGYTELEEYLNGLVP